MRRQIAMQNAAAPDLHYHENKQHSETDGHRGQKIAGDNSLGMIADKGLPRLRGGSPAPAAHSRLLRPVLANRPRRNPDAELQGKLVGDALFSPGHIFSHHSGDELPNIVWKWWAAAPRLPTPVELETFPMPTNESTCLDDH